MAERAKRARTESGAHELERADLGDRRRNDRLRVIMGALEADPTSSFPQVMGSVAELEGLYRFLNNDKFDAADILAPHVQATYERAVEATSVLAIHDTTHVEYETERKDLGVTTGPHHYGFIVHATLLLAESSGLPLGMAHIETLLRAGNKAHKRRKEGQRAHVHASDQDRESLRWLRSVQPLEEVRRGRFEVIHVTDAEGDFFELLASLWQQSARFVLRAGQLDRVVMCEGQRGPLRQFVDEIAEQTSREVELSERKHPPDTCRRTRLRHPERDARQTRLSIGARKVALPKTSYCNVDSEALSLTVVRVWEPEPPPGQPAVEWVLFTTENTSSCEALERVVDIYRKRWRIEEYFKALKTGCALEKRQIESYDALRKVLALFVPIAYRLLLLRDMERLNSSASATDVFSPIDLELMARAPSNRKLPRPQTIADTLTHLARLGGHLPHNGRPGWQTLARGYEKLLLMKLGWHAAMSMEGKI